MSNHEAVLLSKTGTAHKVLQLRDPKKEPVVIPTYIVYEGRLFRLKAHTHVDERNTIVTTYNEVQEHVAVYS